MIKKASLFSALLVSTSAFADVDFYTYGGFETIVDGFKRVALMYSNDSFYIIVAAFLALGIVGALFKQIFTNLNTISQGSGELKAHPAAAIVPALVGAALVKALVMSTTTVHVYDTVKNDYEPVGGVPSILANTAYVLNLVERIYIDDVVDSSTAFLYSENANGVSFKLLYDAIESSRSYYDAYDLMNIKRFYKDCGTHALLNDSNAITSQQLKSNTDDLSSLLSAMQSNAVYTTMFDKDHKAGVTYSCTQAYDGAVKGFVNDNANFTSALIKLCEKNKFDSSTPEQLNACRDRLTDAVDLIYETGSAVDANTFIRNSMIAAAITEQIADDNPDGAVKSLTNQAMVANGISTAIGSQEWYSSLKAMLTVIVLGIAPLLTILFVTPLVTKAFPLMFSLFGFVCLWSLIDATMYQGTLDSMNRAMADIKSHGMGLTAFWLTPSASIKALTVMSDARSSALSIAAMLAATLFGVSAYGLSGVGQGTMGKVESSSNDAGGDVTSPDQSANYLDEMANAQSIHSNVAKSGVDGLTDSKSFDLSSNIAGAQSTMTTVGAGAVTSGSYIGGMSGTRSGSEYNTHADTGNANASMEAMTTTETQHSIGDAEGHRLAASAEGQSVASMASHSSEHSDRKDVRELEGQKEGAQALGVDLYDQVEQKAKVGEITEFGETALSERNMSFIQGANSTGDNQFDQRFAATSLAHLNDMGGTNEIIASGGEISKVTNMQTSGIAGDISKFEGEEYTRNLTGVKLEESRFSEGVSSESEIVGQSNVIRDKGVDDIVEAEQFKAYENINEKIQGANVANENGGFDEATSLKANVQHSEEMAHADNLNEVASGLDMSHQDIAEMRDKATNSEMAVTKEQANDLYEKGVINEHQQGTFADGNGGTLKGNAYTETVTNDLPLGLEVGLGIAGVIPEKGENGTWFAEDVSPQQAGMLLNQGHIDQSDYDRIASGETDRLEFETGTSDQLRFNNTSVSSGSQAELNNSYSSDSSTNITGGTKVNTTNEQISGIDTGNQTSTIDVVTDGNKLYQALDGIEGDEQRARLAAIESSRAFEGIIGSTTYSSLDTSTGVTATVSTPDVGVGGVSASTSVSNNESDQTSRDGLYFSMNSAYMNLADKADGMGLSGDSKDRWVADKYSDLNQTIMDQQDKIGASTAQSRELDFAINNFYDDNGIDYQKPEKDNGGSGSDYVTVARAGL